MAISATTVRERDEPADFRRRFTCTLLSLFVPIISRFFFFHDPKFEPYYWFSIFLPVLVSVACTVSLSFIRASRARRDRLVAVEILSPLLGLAVTGSLVFFSPRAQMWPAFGHSCCLILWGWMLEFGLGLTSQLGLTNTTTALAAAFIRQLNVTPGVYWLLMLVPADIMAGLKVIASVCGPTLFPPEAHIQNDE